MGTMNGIAMASKLSELGTKAFGDYGGVFIGDLRLQNELYEVSGKLRQFVNDMGTNGNCTQADIERFEDTLLGTDKTQYQASRAIMDQMAGIVDGDALANNIDEMGKNLMASNGDESLINALCETSDKLKQFVDDFGTNGRISEADMQKFDAMFAASDGNKYQASKATSEQMARIANGSYSYGLGQCHSVVETRSGDGWGAIAETLGCAPCHWVDPNKSISGFFRSLFGHADQTNAGAGTGPGGPCENNRHGYNSNIPGGYDSSTIGGYDNSSSAGNSSTDAGDGTGPGGACENGRGGYGAKADGGSCGPL